MFFQAYQQAETVDSLRDMLLNYVPAQITEELHEIEKEEEVASLRREQLEEEERQAKEKARNKY